MDQRPIGPERELLVLRCQRGEREAFDELIRAWQPRLLFYVRRFVSNEDDAWQVLQDVWIQVVKGVHALRDPRRLNVWLYSVARNNARSHHRRAYVRRRAVSSSASVKTNVDELARLEAADLVHHGLARLDEGDREVLSLFFLRDLSIDEIAELLGIPSGTVKSRLHTAKKRLLAVLEREGAHDE